jgi:hypothetical protein
MPTTQCLRAISACYLTQPGCEGEGWSWGGKERWGVDGRRRGLLQCAVEEEEGEGEGDEREREERDGGQREGKDEEKAVWVGGDMIVVVGAARVRRFDGVCVCVLLLCVRVCVCWGGWDVRYRERFASRVQPSGDRSHEPPFSRPTFEHGPSRVCACLC